MQHILIIWLGIISIHAPLTGCDRNAGLITMIRSHFNPRTPYGMRLDFIQLVFISLLFQSTHPLRDATSAVTVIFFNLLISIHAPLTGCDKMLIARGLTNKISIHAPLTGCDMQGMSFLFLHRHFNPRTPYGMRRLPS